MVTQTTSRARECKAPVPEAPVRDFTLENYLDDFLLACKVSGLAENSIRTYKALIGDYVRFTTGTLGINNPYQVTTTNIR